MPTTDQELDAVRREVRSVLDQSQSWKDLDPERRRSFAQHMVRIGHFLAKDPAWLERAAGSDQGVAKAFGPVDDLQKRLAGKPGHIGEEFKAGALRQGVEEFGNLVKTVDFPNFVSGLIQGVFQAIVDASIQQMEAFGELLAATAKSVDQFAADHISDDAAREHVAGRYPSIVRLERSENGGGRLASQGEDVDASALNQLAGSTTTIDFSDPESEQRLVQGAKLEMARQRQKMMAMMVMLGINRIVVTNGRINAKVVFDVKASDQAERDARAGMRSASESEKGSMAFVHTPWAAGGGYSRQRHKTTVQSSIDDSSESKAQMKAQLTGEVRVNFKSETLSPERMLDSLQYEQMNYLSQPGGPPVAGAPAAAVPPAAPAAARPV
jgi:hypothetical protein